MKTSKYIRKPFAVDGIQVTAENMADVAAWCDGEIQSDYNSTSFIKVKVQRVLNERQTQAYVGDWVLSAGTGFKVYTEKAFRNSFEPAA